MEQLRALTHTDTDTRTYTHSEDAETDGDEAKDTTDTSPSRSDYGLPAPRIAVAVSGLTAGTVTSPSIAPVPIPVSVVPVSGAIPFPIPIPSVLAFSQNDIATFIASSEGTSAVPSGARPAFPAIPGSLSIAAAAASLGWLTRKRRHQIVDLGLELIQLHGAQRHRYIGTARGVARCLLLYKHKDAECDCKQLRLHQAKEQSYTASASYFGIITWGLH